MRRYSESERGGSEGSLACSERIVLECGECGERLILLGLEEDWYAEGRTAFECECGGRITLVDRLEEGGPYVANLVRDLRASYYHHER